MCPSTKSRFLCRWGTEEEITPNLTINNCDKILEEKIFELLYSSVTVFVRTIDVYKCFLLPKRSIMPMLKVVMSQSRDKKERQHTLGEA